MRLDDLSPGWRSHLVATRFGAEHVERDDCIVLRAPGNPGHYWGNCLIVPAAPADDELARWLQRFDEEIPARPAPLRHIAIGVNAPMAVDALPTWRANGFAIHRNAELALGPDGLVAPVRPRANVVIRELRLPDEIERAVDAICRDETSFEPEGYRVYQRRKLQHLSDMHAHDGRGHWFGVFQGDDLAAYCGLVHDDTLGRFQHVCTGEPWRRLGLCRALIHHVCRVGFGQLGLTQLAMCASPTDVAIGIYQSVGFVCTGEHALLERRAPQDMR